MKDGQHYILQIVESLVLLLPDWQHNQASMKINVHEVSFCPYITYVEHESTDIWTILMTPTFAWPVIQCVIQI